ncbi:hypothetical protein HBN50_11395 [Halobacteriovorax sp. GB3]|uniref:hypothetical protein n=1 Tax=Halobacteriovorax sp. GB3 TaxID=2719615 RepID=UPI00235FD9C6|nr:hypothetical protein [Halobacteriovorax sp. GB3]MDD0853705.1 hypothetical protein [Halobacteriovorax sp. GB3]
MKLHFKFVALFLLFFLNFSSNAQEVLLTIANNESPQIQQTLEKIMATHMPKKSYRVTKEYSNCNEAATQTKVFHLCLEKGNIFVLNNLEEIRVKYSLFWKEGVFAHE